MKYIHVTGVNLGAPSYVRDWRPGYVCYVIEPGRSDLGIETHPLSCVVVSAVVGGVALEEEGGCDLCEVRVGRRKPGWYEANELYKSETAAFRALARRCHETAESCFSAADDLRKCKAAAFRSSARSLERIADCYFSAAEKLRARARVCLRPMKGD